MMDVHHNFRDNFPADRGPSPVKFCADSSEGFVALSTVSGILNLALGCGQRWVCLFDLCVYAEKITPIFLTVFFVLLMQPHKVSEFHQGKDTQGLHVTKHQDFLGRIFWNAKDLCLFFKKLLSADRSCLSVSRGLQNKSLAFGTISNWAALSQCQFQFTSSLLGLHACLAQPVPVVSNRFPFFLEKDKIFRGSTSTITVLQTRNSWRVFSSGLFSSKATTAEAPSIFHYSSMFTFFFQLQHCARPASGRPISLKTGSTFGFRVLRLNSIKTWQEPTGMPPTPTHMPPPLLYQPLTFHPIDVHPYWRATPPYWHTTSTDPLTSPHWQTTVPTSMPPPPLRLHYS